MNFRIITRDTEDCREVYGAGSGRLGVDNMGVGAVRQGMLIGCVEVSDCGHGMDMFMLVVNGDVLVDGFWSFVNVEPILGQDIFQSFLFRLQIGNVYFPKYSNA